MPKDDLATRRRAYFVVMGTCLLLVVLGFFVLPNGTVRLVVVGVAAVLPPIAAIVGNRR